MLAAWGCSAMMETIYVIRFVLNRANMRAGA